MGLLKAIKWNGISFRIRYDPAETQPLMTEITRSNLNHPSKFHQVLAAIVSNIIGISWGTAIGWSSPAIAKMSAGAADSPFDFIPTPAQLSWIGSLLPIGGLVGPIFFAPLPGRIGRKWSLLLNALFFVVSFVILIFTNDIWSMYTARFLQGWGSGVVMVILPIYCGEIASANCRGILSSFIQIGLVVGILYAYCIGPFVDYVLFQWLCLIIPMIFIVTFIFMPDTPHYHISKGDRNKAVDSLRFLRKGCSNEELLKELDEIKNSVEDSLSHRSSFCEMFKGKANILALTIVVGLIGFQNLSGIDAVLFYSEIIFKKAGSSLDSALATILIGAVMLVASCISPFFVESSGRKGLLLTSATGMACSLITMGTYFFLESRFAMESYGWLPVTSLVSFILFYCIGFGPLPFTMLGEMLSPDIKSFASSFAVSACWILDFVVVKAFLPLESLVGNYGNFWIFGGFCIIAFVFTIFFVFETKGLTLDEIQEILKGTRPKEVPRPRRVRRVSV